MTRLEFLRRSRGWSQAALARRLGQGFSAGVLSLIETGRLKPSERQASELQRAFGVLVEDLLDDAVDPTIKRAAELVQ